MAQRRGNFDIAGLRVDAPFNTSKDGNGRKNTPPCTDVSSARFLGPACREIFKTYKEREATAFGKMLEKLPNVLYMRNVPKARPYIFA